MIDRRPSAIGLVVDSSALAAIFFDEPSAPAILDVLADTAGTAVISAASVLETRLAVHARLGSHGVELIDEVLDESDVVAMPFDTQQLPLAHAAWAEFGRGNHAAKLNYGDCFTYALAKHLEVPLLCTGNDFARTDLELVPI